MKQQQFKEPVVCVTGKEFYIFIRFFHNGRWYDIKRREGINKLPTTRERRIEAEALREARLLWLNEGWNPVIDPKYKLRKIKTTEAKKQMSLNAALDFAFSKKKLKGKSIQDYRNILSFIKEVAQKTCIGALSISEIDRGLYLELMDECSKERKFSNHAYNKYISCLRSMLSVLLDYRILNYNPLRDLKARPTPESNKYEAYTEEEKEAIFKHLLKRHYRLFVVMQVVYHTGIRPKEVLALRVSDIDLKERIITIAPDEEEENSKTNNVRRVPINEHLLDLLEEMKLHKFPGKYFAFGSPCASGKGNTGAGSKKNFEGMNREIGLPGISGAMRPDYFTPHATQVKRDTLTKLWKALIIDELGVNKHLYAAKHTGTDDKVFAGLELKEIQTMYGHTSEAMTARYNKKKKEIEAKEQILKKSPAFIIKPKLKAV